MTTNNTTTTATHDRTAPRVAPFWLRLTVGCMLIALGCAAAAWVIGLAKVDFEFRQLSAVPVAEMDRKTLLRQIYRLQQLLQVDPANGAMRNRYASLLGKLGDHKGAIRELQSARKTANAQNGLFFLADRFEKLDRFDRAEEAMADCVLINPINPEFRPAHLRLLNSKLIDAIARSRDPARPALPGDEFNAVYRDFSHAARNWAVRAPHDANSYLFLGQFYVEQKRYLQAYRCYLLGLSRPSWMWLNDELMIEPRDALGTIKQILDGRFAKRYKGLP